MRGQMAGEVDFQMLLFILFFAGATLAVALTRRRKRKYPLQSRCRLCGRTLDLYRDRESICQDCHKLERV